MATQQSRDKIIAAARDFFEDGKRAPAFVAGETYLPASAKTLQFDDLENLLHSVLDLNFTAGHYANSLEKALPEFLDRNIRACLFNSGSSANLVALSALGSPLLKNFGRAPLRPGDEVITVAAGFPTTVNPIVQNQFIPVFVDVDLQTLNATLEMVAAARSSKTKAVVLAHTLGNPFQAEEISRWCGENGLYLIEDCCDALGSKLNGRKVGSFGEMATLSFYPAHHMTTGEGGALFCKDNGWRRIVEGLRDWGRDCWCETGKDNTCQKRFDWQLGELPCGYDHKYIYSQVGYNLKMTDMQAALGLSQLNKVAKFIEARRANWTALERGVLGSPTLREHFRIVQPTEGSAPSWFGFALHCGERIDRRQLMSSLEKRRVGSRVLFAGNLTRQPAYKNVAYRICGKLENTDVVTAQTFWLGVHPGLDEQKINYMLEQLEAATVEQVAH